MDEQDLTEEYIAGDHPQPGFTLSERDYVALQFQVGLIAHYGRETVSKTPFNCFQLAEEWIINRDIYDTVKHNPAETPSI